MFPVQNEIFEFTQDAEYESNNVGLEQKREILSTLGTNLMINGTKLSLYQRKPFKILNGMRKKLKFYLMCSNLMICLINQAIRIPLFSRVCCRAWIRTRINRSKVCCPTIRRLDKKVCL